MVSEWKKFYVPWADISEWETVREQILSADPKETIKAYKTILMWKLRYDSVPAYIECTFSLLQVMIKEYETITNGNTFDDSDLQLLYSTALIRFVNHVSSISTYRGETLYLAAKTQNIPDWIINMRHDAAHGQDLPTLDALHIAAEIGLKWLLDNYWVSKSNFTEKSLSVAQLNLNSALDIEEDINAQNFLHKAFDVWEFIHNTKHKKKLFIGEVERELILHLEEMLNLTNNYYGSLKNDQQDFVHTIINEYKQMEEGKLDKRATCKFKTFKKLFFLFLRNVVKSSDFVQNAFVNCLLQTTFLSENNFSSSKWEPILHLIQEIELFSSLLHILFKLAGEGQRASTKWLTILAPSLNHQQKQWTMFKVLKKENKNMITKSIKQKIKKSCTSSDLVIKLDILKPPVLTLEMMSEFLLNPGSCNIKEITQYLKLIKPPLLKSTIQLIKDLVGISQGTENQKVEVGITAEDKIFTIDDLENLKQKKTDVVREEADTGESGWRKSKIDVHVWNKCPLGVLPFQSGVNCNLPNHLVWKKKHSLMKRNLVPLLKHSVNMKKILEV